jgi:p-hydroxybenzoate 3-monooxygenase
MVGKSVMIYAQHDVNKDPIAARLATGGDLRFATRDVSVYELDSTGPKIPCHNKEGQVEANSGDCVAGCDGAQGICRPSIPPGELTVYEHLCPFGWVGILCTAPPSSGELIYSMHEHYLVLVSTRSRDGHRMYFQRSPTEKTDNWSDAVICVECRARLATKDGWAPKEAPILSKAATGMRSLVVEPMRYGRLFLAGDSAHVVLLTGAKRIDLTASDAQIIASAFIAHDKSNRGDRLGRYSATPLQRGWEATRFPVDDVDAAPFSRVRQFQRHLKSAELDFGPTSMQSDGACREVYRGSDRLTSMFARIYRRATQIGLRAEVPLCS